MLGAAPHIAIVRLSAIGDVVHTLPLVSSIRAALPGARITWIIQPVPHELIRDHPAVDEFVLFRRHPLWKGLAELRAALRGRRFDLALVPQTSLKAALATSLIDAPRKIGFDRGRAPELGWLFTNERIAPRPRGHLQEEALEFADHLAVPRRVEWDIDPTPVERERYAPLLPPHDGPTVAISLASSLPEKDWPAARFAELIGRLVDRFGARTILVGARSAAENAAAATVLRESPAPIIDLRARDLRRLAFLLHHADAFVGPDSGPLHISVALGTPSVALMGYTNPKRVGPVRFRELMVDAFGDPGEVYDVAAPPRSGRMERIEVAEVVEKVGAALD